MEFIKNFQKLISNIYKNRNLIEKEYNYSLVKKIVEKYYESFKRLKLRRKKNIFNKILVILPKNVPVVPLQLSPIIFSYPDSHFFFKLPKKRWKTSALIIKTLFNIEYVDYSPLSHKETEKLLKEFDFIVASGSNELIPILKSSSKPYRFFGPKFTVGFLSESKNEKILKNAFYDFLSFDTEGCLSLRFLFLKDYYTKIFHSILEEVSNTLKPQKFFNKELYNYYTKAYLVFNEGIYTKNSSIIDTKTFPSKFPQRVLFVVKIKKREDVYKFLKPKINSIQGFLYDNEKDFNYFSKIFKNQIFLQFGNSQFPPAGWLFEKNLSIDNFFNVQH